MRAFVVSVNGKDLCTAGIGAKGVLSSHVTWTGREGSGGFHMHVGGLNSETNDHVAWPVKEIGVGDEIVTRIIETEVVDDPVRSHSRAAIEPKFKNLMEGGAGSAGIDAALILFDSQTGGWDRKVSKRFLAVLRIGEWVETEADGIGVLARVVMVSHSNEANGIAGVNLYAVVEGAATDCLKKLTETV